MLKHLQKFFNGDKTLSQEEVTMTDQEKAALAAAELKTAELSAALDAATANLAEKETALAALTAKHELAQAALDASEAAKAELAAQAAAKRLQARTEAIGAAIGKDNAQVATLLAATDAMADEQFNTIVSAMAASFEVEAKSPLFNEQGAAVESVVDEKPTHFNQFIKKEGK
jgi:hypothetical protein